MKISILLLLLFCLCINAYCQDNIKWISSDQYIVSGRLFKDAPLFHRLTEKDRAILSGDRMYEYGGRCAAGMHIDFKTNSKNIFVKWTLKDLHIDGYTNINTQGGVDLYMWNKNYWKYICNCVPVYRELTSERALITEPDFGLFAGKTNIFTLNLPSYEEIESIYIGIDKDATFEPIEDTRKPIVVFGTSITHGACASRPGLIWASRVRLETGENLCNFAFGGTGRLEHEITDILCTLDPKILILEPFPNLQSFELDEVEERLIYFYTNFRKTHPTTPVVIVELEPISHWTTRSTDLQPINKLFRRLFNTWSKHDKYLYKLDTDKTYSDQNSMDTIHPNDVGMKEFADHMLDLLHEKNLIEKENTYPNIL